MLIGTKGVFAFEYEIEQARGKYSPVHLCLWAQGHQVGNFEETSLLGAIESQVERSLLFTGKRYRSDFSEATPDVVFKRIHDALYGDSDPARTGADALE